MDKRMELLMQLGAYSFAAFELQLFLDTHPGNRTAIMQHRQRMDQALALERQYEQLYGPLVAQDIPGSETSWTWIQGPWPWEYTEV